MWTRWKKHKSNSTVQVEENLQEQLGDHLHLEN